MYIYIYIVYTIFLEMFIVESRFHITVTCITFGRIIFFSFKRGTFGRGGMSDSGDPEILNAPYN